MEPAEVHISSMVVQTRPEQLDLVKDQIAEFTGAEIYAESPEGKLVVVLESDDQNGITQTIDRINDLDHVLNTALVYHQIESIQDNEQ